MSTPIAPSRITDWSYPDWLGPGLAALAVVTLAVTAVVMMSTSSEDAVGPALVHQDMTRAEVIERVERINGFTGASAGTSAATVATTSGTADPAHPYDDQTRAEVLERLYRINGVLPVEPEVPAHVR